MRFCLTVQANSHIRLISLAYALFFLLPLLLGPKEAIYCVFIASGLMCVLFSLAVSELLWCILFCGNKIVHHFASGSAAALFSVHTKADVKRSVFLFFFVQCERDLNSQDINFLQS